MLLLVLIFVFVAFGMLLVALVTGTATWAWVSVAVSVAAAGVLVYDWTQRRAAISDGDRIALPVRGPSQAAPPQAERQMAGFQPPATPREPATEAIQPLRGTPPQWTTQVAQRARRDDHAPVGPPPGSSQQPPSAAPAAGNSGWDRSQPVTVPGPSDGAPDPSSGVTPSDDARSGAQSAPPAAASAAAAGGAATQAPAQGAAADGERPPASTHDKSLTWKSQASGAGGAPEGSVAAAAGAAAAVAAAGAVAASASKSTDSDGRTPTGDAAGAAKPVSGDSASAEQGGAKAEPVTDSEQTTAIKADTAPAPAAQAGSGRTGSPVNAPAQAASAQAAPVQSAPAQAAAPSTPAQAAPPAQGSAVPQVPDQGAPGQAAAKSAPAQGAGRTPEGPGEGQPAAAAQQPLKQSAPDPADTTQAIRPVKAAGAAPVVPGAADATTAMRPVQPSDATQAIRPVQPTSEPGEERPDAAAAAIVASLDDEVVVVDEQPRYHLAGCRSIRGRETIPLPAKEAVEYEFTPCEVCTPVRVLAARNRTASKS